MAKRPSLIGAGREALAAAADTSKAGRAAPESAPNIAPVGGEPLGAAAERATGPSSDERRTSARVRPTAKTAGDGTTERRRRAERVVDPATWQQPAFAWSASFEWWEGANALARVNAALVRGAMALCEEMLSFANTRLSHNIETGATLSRCTSPTEILETQVGYARTAAEQYLAEPLKLMHLAAKTTGEGWTSAPRTIPLVWKTADRETVRG